MLDIQEVKCSSVSVFLLNYTQVEVELYLNHLFPEEIERAQSFRNSMRQKEYIATRILRTACLGKTPIQYNEIGAPFIENQGFISISHSTDVVGIAFCKNFSVGLDLEPIRDKAKRVRDKFLSREEKELLDIHSDEEMTKVWSGKEALYKMAGRKQIIFAENLHLKKMNATNWKGRIIFPEFQKSVEMKIEKYQDFIISVNYKKIITER